MPTLKPRYIPLLKLKRAEKQALEMLDDPTAAEIIPLFEIVEMKADGPPLEKHLRTAFTGLRSSLRRSPAYFLDAHEIKNAGPDGAQRTFEAAKNLALPFFPVTGLSRTADLAPALEFSDHGLAIRLTRSEFEEGKIPRRLLSFVKRRKIELRKTHLIVDLGAVDQMVTDGVEAMISQFLPLVPRAAAWRTLTLVACAFPKSMGVATKNSETRVERSDWKGWRGACYEKRNTLPRLPTYADGGIQHPSGVEGFDFRTMQVSATIRYALDEEWLLVKGRSTEVTPERDQFPDLAQRLVRGSGSFAGPRHCRACEGIARAAGGAPKGYSRAEDWRRLGTAHHITRTVQQLRALPLP